MKQSKLLVFLFLVFFSLGHAAKLPASFKTCQRKDPHFNACLVEATEEAIHSLTKPNKELGIPCLEPLFVPKIALAVGTGAVAVQQTLENLNVVGYSKAKIKRFTIDFDKKTAFLECFFDKLQFLADYDISGKIMLLPVFGTGKATFNITDMNITNSFVFEEYQKQNIQYWKVISSKANTNPGNVVLNLGNLFNGNKQLSDNINQMINENWREIYFDISSGYDEALAQINMQMFNAVLSKVPIEELFGKA